MRNIVARFRKEVRVYQMVLSDPRTPWPSKCLLALALAYAISPVDLVPDFIPVLGWLDDLIVVPSLVLLARALIPAAVMADCRRRMYD